MTSPTTPTTTTGTSTTTPTGTSSTTTTSRPGLSPTLLAWLLVGLAANVPAVFAGARSVTVVALCVAGLAHAVVGFWRDGGRYVTAPGIYFYASGLFVFFPGLYITLHGIGLRHGPMELLGTLNVWYFAQLVMHHLVWQRRTRSDVPREPVSRPEVLRWGRVTGVALTAVGVALAASGAVESVVPAGFAFPGVVLLACATFAAPGRVSFAGYALVVGAAGAYVAFVFTGFGRLQLGALGLALAMTVVHRWRGRLVKLAVLVGTAPVLLYLSRARVALTTEAWGARATAGDTGLESVYSPLVRAAELWHMETTTGLHHTYLHSFLTALVAMVPRELWPDKPVGLGAELAMIFRPEYVPAGHSELALVSGEFLLAGGFAGLVVMPFALAAYVLLVERVLTRSALVDTRARLLRTVAVLILTASVTDLVWGGTFTYSARVGPRLLVVVAVLVLFAWRQRRAPEPRPSPDPARRQLLLQRGPE